MNSHIGRSEYDLRMHQMTSVDVGDASIPVQDEERSQFLETAELVGLSMPASNVMFATAIESHKCFEGNLQRPLSFESSVTTDYAINSGISRKRPHDLLENSDVYLSGENSANILFPQLNPDSISAGYCTEDACQEGTTDYLPTDLLRTWLLNCCYWLPLYFGENNACSYLLRCLPVAM